MILDYWDKHPNSTDRFLPQYRYDTSNGLNWDLLAGNYQLHNWTVLNQTKIDGMVVLNGVTPGNGADLSLNLELAKAAISAAISASIPRVIISSSSAVYGASTLVPFHESFAVNPISEYGFAKLAVENFCLSQTSATTEIICIRIGNVAGADSLLGDVNYSEYNRLKYLDQFPDQRGPVRSYIGHETLARVLAYLLNAPHKLPNILNVAAPVDTFMEELLNLAQIPWSFKTADLKANQSITLDLGRLSKIYSFLPKDKAVGEIIEQWKRFRK